MKKLALLLVALLLASMLLAACGSESQDAANDYMKALLNGEIENAAGFVCDDFEVKIDGMEDTADLYANLPGLDETHEIRNVDLKFDLGKGNNAEEVIVTGSYDIVELGPQGKMIADSEIEYELAASVRDRRDLDRDGDDSEQLDTRVLLEMREDGDEWCVRSLEGGYWQPELEDAEEDAEASGADDAATEDGDENGVDEGEAASEE